MIARGYQTVLMEPVKTTITLSKPGTPKLSLLDHDGLPHQTTLPVENGTSTADGVRDKTPYYLLEF